MFNNHYIDWNHRRVQKIIQHYGAPAFFDKTVLDLGCGHADLSGALARLGARVIAVDARQDHLIIAKKKYPHITTMCVDLDQKWPFGTQQFDFVLNLGLICHLTNYQQVLRHSCNVARNLILESEICDSNDPGRVIRTDEHRSVYDWAFNGIGQKPSAPAVESILIAGGIKFKRLDVPELNSGPYKYDWKVADSQNRKIGNRRLWIGKRDGDIIAADIPTPAPRSRLLPANPEPLIIRPELSYTNSSGHTDRSKFKVALCLSGYLRNFDKTFEKLNNNLLRSINPDVFIHTWDYLGSPLRGFDQMLINVSTQSALQRINKLYKPRRLVIEPAIKFPTIPLMHERNFERRDVNGVLSMFYKIRTCNQIKQDYENQHNFKYDCVIRARSDLLFMSPFYITPSLAPDKIYIPHGYDYEGINDQVAYGSSDLMDKYSTTFDNINDMLQKGERFNPEKLLKTNLVRQQVPIERVHMHYYIKR